MIVFCTNAVYDETKVSEHQMFLMTDVNMTNTYLKKFYIKKYLIATTSAKYSQTHFLILVFYKLFT